MNPIDLIRAQSESATRNLPHTPCEIVWYADSVPARTLHLAWSGRPLDEVLPFGEEQVVLDTVAQRAVDILRRHGGAGAAAVAETIACTPCHGWQVHLFPEGVGVVGLVDGEEVLSGTTPYDSAHPDLVPSSVLVRQTGPVSHRISHGGRAATVSGPNGPAVVAAEMLVMAAIHGQPPQPPEGRRLTMGDADMARYLLDYYCGPDGPRVVAEAIRALRELGQDRDKWLTRVLASELRLRPLANRVRAELGEGR